MLLALAIHNAEAVLIQIYVRYAYELEEVQRGELPPGPDFFSHATKGFVALGTCVNLTIVGVMIVKINFLLFFRRLASHMRRFVIMWWLVLAFCVGGAIAQIGMQEFGCFFGSAEYIFGPHCTSGMERILINATFSAVVDAVSDVLSKFQTFSRQADGDKSADNHDCKVIGFPVAILWNTKISRKKKLILTILFCLVFFTIAITIVRGSIFHSIYDANNKKLGQLQSTTFTWFWFYTEFSAGMLRAVAMNFHFRTDPSYS